jgi:hypothetical protein
MVSSTLFGFGARLRSGVALSALVAGAELAAELSCAEPDPVTDLGDALLWL